MNKVTEMDTFKWLILSSISLPWLQKVTPNVSLKKKETKASEHMYWQIS